MKSTRSSAPWCIAAPFLLGACVQIIGIDDPKPLPRTETSASSSSSTSSSASSSSSSSGGGEPPGPWAEWPMPNPVSASLPNPAKYVEDTTNDIVIDEITGLMWQRTIDDTTRTWNDAGIYCASLDHAGYDDWRLPWRIELVSLVDYTKTNPAIDSAFPATPTSEFWTASISADNSSNGWVVHFEEGVTATKSLGSAYRVRCVRQA